jgi:DNA/RNA-binding domain of Phe-tRNA-synthetase-like protein
MQTIFITDTIRQKIKGLNFGLVQAKNVSVKPTTASFDTELQNLEQEIKQNFCNTAPSENEIVSSVRRMYRQVGWEPTKYRPSSEALIRRLLQNKGLYRINNLVDYGNLVSARYHIPMGLYDLDKISGKIVIDTGLPNEEYQGISKALIHASGKIILRDDVGVFGNPTADSRRTSISAQTKISLAVFFCPANIADDYVIQAISELAGYYKEFSETREVSFEIQKN